MPKYVAFLRAINVGGHVLKMDRLKDLFLAMGFANVETFIASGNVIFDSKSKDTKLLERKIEKQLQSALGYAVATFIRTPSELAAIAGYEPFKNTPLNGEFDRIFVGFLSEDPSAEARQKVLSAATDVDVLHIQGRELYWLCRVQFNESKFSGTLLEKTLGMETTIRNTNTVRRIVAKYS